MRLVALALVAVLLVGACGGDDSGEPSTTPDTVEFRAYFTLLGKVWPVRRVVPYTESIERAALDALVAGPTDQEVAELGLAHAIPTGADLQGLLIEGAKARIEYRGQPLREHGVAQVVYTLTQFPNVTSVELVGSGPTLTLDRSDVESFAPAILVESPLAYEEVTSPLRVTGTANTFEATFQYELTDTDGRIVDENFVTATSGTGMRGTFDFTTGSFAVPFDGLGSLIVFESSAEDGARINLVEIPLRMSK